MYKRQGHYSAEAVPEEIGGIIRLDITVSGGKIAAVEMQNLDKDGSEKGKEYGNCLLYTSFAYYRTRGEMKKRIVLLFCLAAGVAAAAVSAIIRSIPNFINRTSLSFFSLIPVVASLLGLLLLMALKRRMLVRREWLFECLFTVFLSVYCISSFFYYLPPVLSQLNTFVYYGESAVSTTVLFRIIGYALALLLMLLSGLCLLYTSRCV